MATPKSNIGKVGTIIILVCFTLAKGCQAVFGSHPHHEIETEQTDK